MFTKSYRLFSILGFKIGVDLSWLFLAALIIWSLGTGYFPDIMPGRTAQVYYGAAAVAAIGMFASIVFHELAHSIVARRFHIKIGGITLFIFGGVAELEDEPPTPISEFLVAIAGPISSVVLAGIVSLIAHILPDATPDPVFAVLSYLVLINVVLAVFNLIPAFPLDGGRMLRAGLWWAKGSLVQATKIASTLGAVLGAGLMAYGAYNSMQGPALNGAWQILIGFFILNAAGSERRQSEVLDKLHGVTVAQLMKSAPPMIPGEVTVDQVTGHPDLRGGDAIFPVTDNGRIIGLVQLSELQKIPQERRATTLIRDAATPLSSDDTLTPDQSAVAALRLVNRSRGRQAFVLKNGQLAGRVQARDIFAFIDSRTAMQTAGAGHPA